MEAWYLLQKAVKTLTSLVEKEVYSDIQIKSKKPLKFVGMKQNVFQQ